jgi:hypothetical protein
MMKPEGIGFMTFEEAYTRLRFMYEDMREDIGALSLHVTGSEQRDIERVSNVYGWASLELKNGHPERFYLHRLAWLCRRWGRRHDAGRVKTVLYAIADDCDMVLSEHAE